MCSKTEALTVAVHSRSGAWLTFRMGSVVNVIQTQIVGGPLDLDIQNSFLFSSRKQFSVFKYSGMYVLKVHNISHINIPLRSTDGSAGCVPRLLQLQPTMTMMTTTSNDKSTSHPDFAIRCPCPEDSGKDVSRKWVGVGSGWNHY